jgi:formyltetrahydrofolate-dependent phosphoribosylglycinamide formyltransferase
MERGAAVSAPGIRPARLAVLLSGSGTTLDNFFVQHEAGELPVEFVCVLASRPDAYGLERAKRRGVPTAVVARKSFKGVEPFSKAVFAALEPYRPELICLAGWMCLLRIPPEYEGRILNVHPALLPAFGGKGLYGHHVHESVLAAGCRISGCTVHLVDNQYDHGPIIVQKTVDVREDDTPDTLAERVQAAEREVYPEAVRLYVAGRLKVEGRRVRILP